MGKFDKLKAAGLEDARGNIHDPEAHRGELLAGGRWRRLKAFLETPQMTSARNWITAATLLVGAVSQLVHVVRAQWLAPAELPKTGVASTALDRVEKPKPP